jgi:hypothetical protein
MITSIPDNCGNSPRSLLAIEIAINLATNKYEKLGPLLAEDFSWIFAGSAEVIAKSELKERMDKVVETEGAVEKFEILTAISHGKYAAVSSLAYVSNGKAYHSHDLYEFSSAGASAKLKSITFYTKASKS